MKTNKATLAATDAESPLPGGAFSDLVRAGNGCGATLGEDQADQNGHAGKG